MTDTKRNGCHDKPMNPVSTPAQDGWIYQGDKRFAKVVMIPHAMSITCQYSRTTIDPGCDGCQNRQTSDG